MKLLKLVIAIIVVGLLGISILLDFAFGIYTDCTFLMVMTGVITLLVVWLTFKLKRKMKCAIIVGSLFFIMSIRYWDYNSLKPFLRSMDELKKGMTKKEVIKVMSDYQLAGKGKGFIFVEEREAEPLLDSKVEFLNFTHTEEEWGNSDWGYVYFLDNKLYRTGFSGD